MKNSRLISVVIPARNAGRTLESTLRSILRQDIPLADVVVSDDFSSDDTPRIALDFYPKVKLVRTCRRSGPDAARRLGFENCKGKFVTFVDADDRLAPHALRRAFYAMDDNTDVVFMRVVRFISGLPFIDLRGYTPDPVKVVESSLYGVPDCPPSVWGKLFRREVLEPWPAIGYDGWWGEDRLWILELFKTPLRVRVCEEAVYRYRLGGSGSDARRSRRGMEFRQVARLKHEFADRNAAFGYAHALIDSELEALLAYRNSALNSGFAARLKNMIINYRR